MDIEQFRDELKRDEGVKNEVYLDHLGLPTCGIGHLITEWDTEYGADVGTPVAEERVNELFEKDLSVTIEECKHIYHDFDVLPVKVQHIVANMMFNLGRPRYSKFRKHIQAVMDGNWQESANQMRDSRWHKQVPNRAERLCKRMEEVTVS
mgnify:CR=1 FL=1